MDIEELLKRKEDLEGYYKKLHTNFQKYLDAFHGKWKINVPEGFEPHIPPTARTKIETLAGALTPETLQVAVPPRKISGDVKAAEEQAQHIKEFSQDALQRLDRCSGYSIIQETITDILLYGMTCVKGIFYDPDAWGKKPERRKNEDEDEFNDRLDAWEGRKAINFPLRASVVDPLNLYPDPDIFNGLQPSFVIEAYTRKVGQMRREYPDVTFKGKTFDDVEIIEYWDAERRIIADEEKIVLSSPHVYGYVPYVFAFSGLGKGSPHGKPEERAVGLLALIYSSLYSEILDRTALDISNQFTGIPLLRSTPDLPGSVQLIPGTILRLDPTVPLTTVLPHDAGAGRGIYDSLMLTRSDIEEASYGGVLSGMSIQGVESGVHQQMLATLSRRRYSALITDLERMWAVIASRILQVMEQLVMEPLNSYLRPEEIKSYYVCQVKFILSDEAYRRAMVTEARSLRGLLSDKTIRETKLNLPNSDSEEAQLLLEQIVRNPAVLDSIAKKALMLNEAETTMANISGEAVAGTPRGMGGQAMKGMEAAGGPAGKSIGELEKYYEASPMGGKTPVEGEL